jgi:uncharacterized protein YeaO (DUF488 family)
LAGKPNLGPSRELLAAFHANNSSPISWPQYRQRYLVEMKAQKPLIQSLADRAKSGETITLLCSSACTRESHCHRSLLRELIEQAIS